MIEPERIQRSNEPQLAAHRRDVDHLGVQLADRKRDLEQVVESIRTFEVAIPSWALGTGGTRFGRFPGRGEPRDVYEKMEDISVIHRLTGAAPRVSLHIPWDEPDDAKALVARAGELSSARSATRIAPFETRPSNTTSMSSKSAERWDRKRSASGSPTARTTRDKHTSDAATSGCSRVSRRSTHACLTSGGSSPSTRTVVQDWGSSLMLALSLGERASCLVDLGHHLPNTNIEMIVARLITAGKLGGFHFNDSKYGDDDLTTGSIRPYQLFLVFNELVDAGLELGSAFEPAYMIDQSHNLKDPIEALLQSVVALQKAYARALLVDRERLAEYQQANDVIMAERTLTESYETDVRALAAEARMRNGGALDPVRAFRESGYRDDVAKTRTASDYVPPSSL